MEGYGYSYPPSFPPMREYPDHGDGFGDYHGSRPLNADSPRRGEHREEIYRTRQKRGWLWPCKPPNRGVPWWWEQYAYMMWNNYGYDYENYYDYQPMNFHPSENYGQGDLIQDDVRPSGSKQQRPLRKSRHKRSHSHESETKSRTASKSRSRTRSRTSSRSRSRTRSRSKTRSKTRSRSRSRAPTRSCSGSRRQLSLIKPGFLDAFRVMYLTPSKHKKSTTKYLATQKRQDRVHEILKSDRLGSKRWYFYPRQTKSEPAGKRNEVPGTRDNCDQRIKIDSDFLRHYKRSKNYDADAPIAKLKHWEIQLYKSLGFIQAV